MKIVAVTQRVEISSERDEKWDVLDQRLAFFLLMANVLPVPIPNTLYAKSCCETLYTWLGTVHPQAFVLSGGHNIGQNDMRDSVEEALLDFAHEHRMPVLGICRGMQMMAHWAGTALRPVKGHIRTRHHLSGKISDDVNSYHGYSLAQCPENFEILAQSEDGEIEAIRHTWLPWEGWMWHPERERNFSVQDVKRASTLFSIGGNGLERERALLLSDRGTAS